MTQPSDIRFNRNVDPAKLCKMHPALLRVPLLCTFAGLTHRVCIIQFEAAENLVNVSGMEKPIASHHHLETLWDKNKTKQKNKKSASTIRDMITYFLLFLENPRHLGGQT